MTGLHVFSGPSLHASDVSTFSAACVWHPPARRGDLLRANLRPGDRMLLIDGYYGSVPATPHMELLELLARDVQVFGCSSMGALRAAELYPQGMLGLGWVFEAYRHGLVTADDEVAVMHDPISYDLLSVPLINVRFALWHQVQRGLLNAEHVAASLAALCELPFIRRTPDVVVDILDRCGVPDAPTLLTLQWDIKRRDAVQAVTTLCAATSSHTTLPAPTAFRKALIRATATNNRHGEVQ